MSFKVLDLMVSHDSESDGLNSYGFRQFFESYIQNVIKYTSTRPMAMSPVDAVRFKGDLSGWLLTTNTPYDYHWCIARINGYLDPTQYDGTKLVIMIPSTGLIDNLHNQYINSKA